MSDGTGITWASSTWNPTSGCTPISEGCRNCYAEKMAKRLQAMGAKGYERGFEVTLHPERLGEPLHWREPRVVFVVSMGDLFHEDVPLEFIAKVFAVMQLAQHHTFLVLTKRPERMAEFYRWLNSDDGSRAWLKAVVGVPAGPYEGWSCAWPFRNIWLGVTAENQLRANKRIPILTQIPAAHRFVSIEPILGPVDLTKATGCNGWDGGGDFPHDPRCCIQWVIAGGESGPGYRPMDLAWVRGLRDQCRAAGVPLHFKQASGVRPAKLPLLDGVVYDAAPPFGDRA